MREPVEDRERGADQPSALGTASMLQFVHELRSPIATIQNCLDVILQGYGTGDTARHQEMLRLARLGIASITAKQQMAFES